MKIQEPLMEFIDLRSDTVTKPTAEMRAAMAEAPVGDDVYGEDPTVNRMQAMASELMGKEAGLFVPSGTMGNLAALLAHCGRGDEIILGDKAHTFTSEAAGMAALGGVHSYQIPNQVDGTLDLGDIIAAIRPDNPHQPVTRLIALENTHNRCGGAPLSVEYTQSVGDIARRYGLRLHLDGARIFNAAVALGVQAADLAAAADSVTFCLSKGLSAPVGSVLCGSRDFITRVHRIRKQLGGGMRQAGILAAAGIVALETMIDRLAEDHRRARRLAEGVSGISDLSLVYGMPRTNMVFLSLSEGARMDAPQIGERLVAQGVRVHVTGSRTFRLVTHHGIDDAAIEKTIEAFKDVMRTM
jgi:threonine aldolase